MFDDFCNSVITGGNTTNTSVDSNATGMVKTSMAQAEHVSILEIVDSNARIVFISIGALIVVVLIFGHARAHIASAKANDARALAEAKLVTLREANLRIRKELKLHGLNNTQAKIVKAGSSKISDLLPPEYRLNWHALVFEAHIGSGTFGDCFKGTKSGQAVAIKKMRAGQLFQLKFSTSVVSLTNFVCFSAHTGLVDKKGLEAFMKEIITLYTLDHVNIITLVGYCLDPNLLIVTEFVSGGTLSAFVRAHDMMNPPPENVQMNILTGQSFQLQLSTSDVPSTDFSSSRTQA